ncbi:tRNA (adenosine(37)-N6)-threonylcarbamoyltransferase complex dimerization subunit type 1 TsaB [Solitalea sp. MAHUQ-68]|uniref:tRNA (Adenosine(37)-N6)-threonylcarbamoyltransferase complex dimerization subunit type 1 TsaB n=1 Tax=Solitalea agri TaxID=2953739 RepID=A0A9X2F168_9SPHI|nr:tRNA (adenosine(37)-N6)-threonylcarbamoyltransferase complex dimerization subunit type 1 TsaB [Solitalea agri]MCO4292326.1 tRNA (adenosine(37)-N6)-threonylcarbamoyltransferase complex dimerization subunit type 1 TsaB [Solitalea agri]
MALILSIETATACCSVALSNNEQVIAFKEETSPNIHASSLTVFIEEILQASGLSVADLDAIAVSMGPGSYTGLRIGVSTAKGLCYSLNKPLIAINTLKAMANGYLLNNDTSNGVLLCPMIDARRMEVFTTIYNQQLNEVEATNAAIINETSFTELLGEQKIVFFGNGAEKCKSMLTSENALFDTGAYNSARFVAPLAYVKYLQNSFEDVAYFEPFYLKDFVSTQPKKN